MSTHDSSPPSETTGPCCYWCSRISLRRIPTRPSQDERTWLQELFHSDCECLLRENVFPSSACGFCKHFHIRHLVHCALIRDNLKLPTIVSDWYCRENLRNGCQLCEYISSYGTPGPEIGLAIYKTRRYTRYVLRLTATNGEHHPNYIHLSPDSVSRLQEHVNWEKSREWLFHGYPKEGDLPNDFRVIDVERNCIVTPDFPVKYVALSYVWGDSSQKEKPFQASAENIEGLEIEESLSQAPLPRTITDAMEVCRQLDRQYLWVDRLCIIQDHESKHGQIQRMNSIFGSSDFTIIAVSGRDANDGLPGVSLPRKSPSLKFLEWQGIVLTEFSPSIEDLIQSSYWAKRGWTFQEELCSRNNLYFTENGVYYSSSTFMFLNTESPTSKLQRDRRLFRFPDSVEEYAARYFIDPGDLLRAFIGVLNMEFGHDHRFGNVVPRSARYKFTFDEWIHWQPVDWECEARRPPKDISAESVSHIQPHKSDIFPSWSWTSVQGGVQFYRNIDPVALWAFPIAQESREDSNVEWMSRNCEAHRLRDITVEGGLMKEKEFPFQPTSDLEAGWKLISASSTLFAKADRDEAYKKLGRILSFTQVASLRLKSLDHQVRDGRRTFRIMSSADRNMGEISLPKLSLKYISNKDGGLKEKEFKFMALSLWEDGRTVERFLNDYGLKDPGHLVVLNVMLVWHAKESNVARRLGIGQVFPNDWLEERPVLKTIVLE